MHAFALLNSIHSAVAMATPYTAVPVRVFIIRRKPFPSVENRAIITVCRPRTDIAAPTKFSAFAADRTGLAKVRDFTRFAMASPTE